MSNKILKHIPEESKNPNTTQNLYIEGDNLEVLKLLQKSYYGKVKMIYIDPPYNTGKDFVYKDDFHDSLDNYKRITGQVDGNGNRLSTNTEASGRYHTDWLNMMYPRLRLARNLLKDDGIIFISIDDNELANLRKICDEVFGEENFIDCMIWKKRYGGGAKEKHLVTLHEYVMFYSKNINSIGEIFVPLSKESIERYYSKRDEKYEIRGGYRSHPLEAGKAMDARPNLVYEIIAPDGTPIMPQKQWLWAKERVENAIKNNEIEFTRGKNGKWVVSTKQYLRDEFGVMRKGKAFSIIDNIYTQHGTNEMINIMGDAKIFNYPKPTEFVRELLTIGTDKDSIILDFFSGSASTAHAVIQLNAEDGGNRKFIMVQLPEPTDEKSEAYKAGYKNICEIGKERIRRAGEKIKEENKDKDNIENLDIGFKVFKLVDQSEIEECDVIFSPTYYKQNVNIKFKHYSFRKYGEPKLVKPKELKGIKPVLSVDYIPNKCKCSVFVKDDDVWIKHNDYFSPSMKLPLDEIGKPLSYLANKYCNKNKYKKFIYDDAWGSIVLRQECWIHIEGLYKCIKDNMFVLDIRDEILRQQERECGFDEYQLEVGEMSRFWENVINKLKSIS